MIEVVALSAFGLAAVGGIVLLAIRLTAARDSEGSAIVQEALANRAQLEAEKERDAAVVARAQAEAERDAALAQLTATQQTAVVAAKENAGHVHDAIANAPPADAGDLLDAQLSSGFLIGTTGTAGLAPASGQRDPGAPAVPAAAAAGPVARSAPRAS